VCAAPCHLPLRPRKGPLGAGLGVSVLFTVVEMDTGPIVRQV
jgi:hypothetical protein